jgi:peptidoglycan/LPS O-acetylase OafA/YrhL
MTAAAVSSAHRIPSLDGLRALSIAFVIIGHLETVRLGALPTLNDPIGLILGNGPFGVSVFFVISGFLITGQLLRELDRSGTVSLKGFYWRRTFRIIPALALYLATVGILGSLGKIGFAPRELVSAATFTKDYTPWMETWSLHHMWSLSVEEQFYLLWPAVLLRAGRKTATRIAVVIVVGSPIVRVVHYAIFGGIQPGLWEMLHTRADALMFGCIAALEYESPRFRALCRRGFRFTPLLVVFVVCIAPLLTERFRGSYLYTVGYTLEGVTILLSMLWAIENGDSIIGRVLNSRIVAHVGVISYSVYLWQQLCLDPAYATGHLVRNVAIILVAAELSYWGIERSALRLRRRVQTRATLPATLSESPTP